MSYKVNNTTVIDDSRNIISNTISHTFKGIAHTGGALTLDLSEASYFKVTNSSSLPITSIAFSNIPSTYATLFVIEILYSSSTIYSITWPVEFKWSDGIAPSLSYQAGKKDVFVFFTTDSGTSWNAFIAGQNL